MKFHLTHANVLDLCRDMGQRIINQTVADTEPPASIKIYPIPRGGVPVAYMLQGLFPCLKIADKPGEADCYVDDIIDSGATREKWSARAGMPHIPFHAMIDKSNSSGDRFKNSWIVFPWEGGEKEVEGIEDNIRRIIQFIGDDPKRGGLEETPARVAKAWKHWCSGYHADIPKLLKTFKDGAEDCGDEMVIVKDIPFYTHCEHHMAPFFGTATVAYIPEGRIVGLSKLPRVVDAFARRLQVQERLTNQVANAIQEHLKPKGVGVIIKARHLCMESRGIQQQGHTTITSALRGVMRDLPEARAEFLNLTK